MSLSMHESQVPRFVIGSIPVHVVNMHPGRDWPIDGLPDQPVEADALPLEIGPAKIEPLSLEFLNGRADDRDEHWDPFEINMLYPISSARPPASIQRPSCVRIRWSGVHRSEDPLANRILTMGAFMRVNLHEWNGWRRPSKE